MIHALPSGGALHEEPGGSGVPVLLLHGVGGAAWSFAPQARALGSRRTCFLFEGRGHGAAAATRDAGLADYYVDAGEALSLVMARAGRAPIVVGHSMGGLMALALACERPAEVAGVALVDPVYAEAGEPPRRLPRALLVLVRMLVAVVARSYQCDGWLSRFISRRFFRWAFHDRAAMERAWALQRTQIPLEYPRMLFEALDGVRGFPFQPFADRLHQPVLLVEALPAEGARSRFVQLAARLAARLGASFTVEPVVGGHYLQLDRPDAVSQRIGAFARRLDEASGGHEARAGS